MVSKCVQLLLNTLWILEVKDVRSGYNTFVVEIRRTITRYIIVTRENIIECLSKGRGEDVDLFSKVLDLDFTVRIEGILCLIGKAPRTERISRR